MPARTKEQWKDIGRSAVKSFVASQGAVVWPEVEAALAETDWVHLNVDRSVGAIRGPQPHVLSPVRRALELSGELRSEAELLNGREVRTYLDTSRRLAKTEIAREAARKRRLYRSFLSWTGDSRLCGDVAEKVVLASMESLAGRHLWVPPQQAGHIREIRGELVPIGPLDALGALAVDEHDPNAGFIPFAVEVKNIRSWVYPWHGEVWDLLTKVAKWPDIVPILVARRVHITTFRMFRDIGAVAVETRRQFFSSRVDEAKFRDTTQQLGLHDAIRVPDAERPDGRIERFFEQTLRKDGLLARQAGKWAQVATVAADYGELRDEDLTYTRRNELYRRFTSDVRAAGMEISGWGPEEWEEEDFTGAEE